jgi:hypothetical protein
VPIDHAATDNDNRRDGCPCGWFAMSRAAWGQRVLGRDGAPWCRVCQYLCMDFSPLRTFCGGVQLLSYRTQSITQARFFIWSKIDGVMTDGVGKIGEEGQMTTTKFCPLTILAPPYHHRELKYQTDGKSLSK